MPRALAFLVSLLSLSLAACGPTVVHAPDDMGDVARVRLAPEGMGFEVELPAEARSSTTRDRMDGFTEPMVGTEWTVETADRSAIFSVTHMQYPTGLGGVSDFVTRMLDLVPRNIAENAGGRIASRGNVRPGRGIRGVQFRIALPDQSSVDGRLYFRGDVSVMALFIATRESTWRPAGQRMLRSLRFLPE